MINVHSSHKQPYFLSEILQAEANLGKYLKKKCYPNISKNNMFILLLKRTCIVLGVQKDFPKLFMEDCWYCYLLIILLHLPMYYETRLQS